jgi:hypothetical protein
MYYKNRYLNIKNDYNRLLDAYISVNQTGGMSVTTIHNNGELLEGGIQYKNQCFWISILAYLRANGYPRLTLRQLRTDAGLDLDTAQIPVDTTSRGNGATPTDSFYRISAQYNIIIRVYRSNSHGGITRDYAGSNIVDIISAHYDEHGDVVIKPPIGFMHLGHMDGSYGDKNIVNLANNGGNHFELITRFIDEAPDVVHLEDDDDILFQEELKRIRLQDAGIGSAAASTAASAAAATTASEDQLFNQALERIRIQDAIAADADRRAGRRTGTGSSSIHPSLRAVAAAASTGPSSSSLTKPLSRLAQSSTIRPKPKTDDISVPLVMYKNKMTKITDIREDMRETYLDYADKQVLLRVKIRTNNEIIERYTQLYRIYEDNKPHNEDNSDILRELKFLHNENINIVKEVEELKDKILSLEFIIGEYEDGNIHPH